jgi:hypothetical protein
VGAVSALQRCRAEGGDGSKQRQTLNRNFGSGQQPEGARRKQTNGNAPEGAASAIIIYDGKGQAGQGPDRNEGWMDGKKEKTGMWMCE